jgi:cell division protein DivIC
MAALSCKEKDTDSAAIRKMGVAIHKTEMIGGESMGSAGAEQVTRLQTNYLQSHEMNEKRKRKRRKGLIRRLVAFFAVFALVCTFMISSLISQSHQLNRVLQTKAGLTKQLDQSKLQAGQLKKRIKLLHDKKYIGEIARRDYLLSNKGEIIFSKPNQDKD